MNKCVTIIIPTKNSEKTIHECLYSIINQTYSNIEVLVIDNYSEDCTIEIVKSLNIRYILAGPERCAQRNIGAYNSKGDYLCFIDSDMYLSSTVISECVKNVNSKSCLIIPEVSIGDGFWSKAKSIEKKCYIGDDLIEAARFFKKQDFFSVGGWDENLVSGEDFDLTIRMRKNGYLIGRINSLIYHDEGKIILGKAMKKKFYYGLKLPRYFEKNPKQFIKQSSPLRISMIRNWKYFFETPILYIGMICLKIMELTSLFFGFIFGLIKKSIIKIKVK